MSLKEQGSVKYITFDIFEQFDFINCAISTKYGGVSEGIYNNMNLSFSIGDTEENVYENYKIFSDTLGFEYINMQRGYQTHSTNVYFVNNNNIEKFSNIPQFADTDAIITDAKDVPLVTLFADCVPLFFADVENKVVAVGHAGWRGTLNFIAKEIVINMQKMYNTKKEHLYVGIGPSIHNCCFLVNDDVYQPFNKIEQYRPYIKKVDDRYSIDLQNINKINLINTGLVLENNIEISLYCTCCEKDLFFSHRRDNINRGSMAGMISIVD